MLKRVTPASGGNSPAGPALTSCDLLIRPQMSRRLDSERIYLPRRDPDPERTRYLLGEVAIVAGAQGHEAMKRGDTTTVAATLKTARLGAAANPVIADYVKRAELFLQTSTQDQNP